MLKLVHHPLSAKCRFIRLCLAEYGEVTSFIEAKPWQRSPSLLQLNPAGTVPIMVEQGGPALCGPEVIMEYIDETRGIKQPDKRLMPEQSFERAEIRRLAHWFLGKMDAEVTEPIYYEKIIRLEQGSAGGSPDSQVIRIARNNMRAHLHYIGYLAGTRNYLGGERLSYADLAAAASISVIDYTGDVPWTEDEAAKNWYQRIKSRPSFRPLLADRVKSLKPVPHYVELDF